MKPLLFFLLTLFFSLNCFATITVKDLPYVEGTSLEPQNDPNDDWLILDYLEDENGLLWVWLSKGSQLAYLVYPSETYADSMVFPDSRSITLVPEHIHIVFLGEPDQQVSITRFGGKTVLQGDDIRINYTLGKYVQTNEGSLYTLNSSQSLDISFSAYKVQLGSISISGDLEVIADSIITYQDISTNGGDISIYAGGNASLTTSGLISTIAGPSDSNNTLQGADTDNSWSIGLSSNGSLNLTSFTEITNLSGGAGSDTFVVDGNIEGSINGGSGIDSLHINGSNPSYDPIAGVTISTPQSSSLASDDTELNSIIISTPPANLIETNHDAIEWTAIDRTTFDTLQNEEQSNTTKKSNKGGATNAPILILFLFLMLSLRGKPTYLHT